MIEDVVDEIKATLVEHLPGETAVFGLVPVEAFLVAERDLPLVKLPAIFLLAGSTRETPLFPFHDEVHTISIVTVFQHIDAEDLARALFRYNRAVRRALGDNLPHSPQQFITARRFIRHDYTPTAQTDSGAYTKAVALEMEATERLGEV